MKKHHHHLVKDDRAIPTNRQKVPKRVAPRLEGVVKNAGIKEERKEKKPDV